uniref:Semaphorin 7A (JohnMiltonHagen blood group) n=1 Tax=Tetraodon nigroviridis TaxID=99883 RepID=H3CSL6_TETNG
CSNVITVIEKFQDSLFVCGTNGQKPRCWKLYSSVNNQPHEIMESYEGMGISPLMHTQNSISLTVEEDLYAAAPLDTEGRHLLFRRKGGSRTNVWMYDSWVSEPTFISASWVQRQNDPDNEKIYIFFREKNSDTNPEADPWISRVARVCKVDEGGSKRFFQNIWTSFLKARLVCGFPEESLYFNRLQDTFVMHADDWHDTRIYALFTSSWNSTAVCVYSIDTIEEVFENSTFRGYHNAVPTPRPGTCNRNSRSLPLATINLVKNHPEMSDWVHSVHYTAPFYVSNNNYVKIAVDRVQAADQCMYNVLLLSTDSGKIHKVLEADSKPFVISQTQLSSRSPVQSIQLDAKRKRLVVGFSEKISAVELQRCQDYNSSCEKCVLARDPYCAWTDSGCSPHVLRRSILEQKQLVRTRREADSGSAEGLGTSHSVPLGVPFYLSCPIDSYHAVYTWRHKGQTSPCLQMQSNCLHLIPVMTEDMYGKYTCVSQEKGYTNEVKSYHLTQHNPNSLRDLQGFENDASAVVPQLWVSLGCYLSCYSIVH